jgi:hypothetical protein
VSAVRRAPFPAREKERPEQHHEQELGLAGQELEEVAREVVMARVAVQLLVEKEVQNRSL